jgi:hypothetical protein
MSHLNAFTTEMSDKDALLKALTRMGIPRNCIEVHDRAQPIVGYHGTSDHKVGHIIVRRQHARIPSDIGWEKVGDKYLAHVDDFDYTHTSWRNQGAGPGSPIYNQAWNTELLNYYITEKKKAEMEAKGLTVIEERDELNRIRLRAKFVTKNTTSKIQTRS